MIKKPEAEFTIQLDFCLHLDLQAIGAVNRQAHNSRSIIHSASCPATVWVNGKLKQSHT